MKCRSIMCVMCVIVVVQCVINAQEPSDGGPDHHHSLTTRAQSSTSCNTTRCTILRDAKRAYDLEMLKAKILKKLRISHVPNITLPIPRTVPYVDKIISDNLNRTQQRYNVSYDAAGEDYQNDDHSVSSSSPQSISNHDTYPSPPPLNYEDDPPTIYNIFYLSEIDETDQRIVRFQFKPTDAQLIVTATLFLYVSRRDRAPDARDENIMVNIQRLVAPERPGGPLTKELVRKKRVTTRQRGSWVQVDTTQTVTSWVERPSTNLGFYLNVMDTRRRVPTILTNNFDYNQYRPYMDVHYREPTPTVRPPIRTRRTTTSTTDCIESSTQSQCCRYPLMLNFTAIGWHFILSPPVVHTYYCSGECPYLFMPTVPRTLFNNQGGPCCSPTKYSEIDILYINTNGTITHSSLPNLIVDRCGCN